MGVEFMSELISGNIILKDIKRNYYSMPSISVSHETKKSFPNGYIHVDEITPAGIPSVNANESAVTFINPENIKSEVIYENNAPKTPKKISNAADSKSTDALSSYIRFYNFTPKDLNIYTDDKKGSFPVKSNDKTDYYRLNPEVYSFKIAEEDNEPLYEYKFNAYPRINSTIIITKNNSSYNITDISGVPPKCFFNTAYIRFVQLSETAPAMDIFIDGIPVILGITFGEVSAFIGVPNGIHNINAVVSGTGIISIDEEFNFPENSVNSFLIALNDSGNYTANIITDTDSCA
jgi:hypothetical protein